MLFVLMGMYDVRKIPILFISSTCTYYYVKALFNFPSRAKMESWGSKIVVQVQQHMIDCKTCRDEIYGDYNDEERSKKMSELKIWVPRLIGAELDLETGYRK